MPCQFNRVPQGRTVHKVTQGHVIGVVWTVTSGHVATMFVITTKYMYTVGKCCSCSAFAVLYMYSLDSVACAKSRTMMQIIQDQTTLKNYELDTHKAAEKTGSDAELTGKSSGVDRRSAIHKRLTPVRRALH